MSAGSTEPTVLMIGTPAYGGLTPRYVLSLIETRAKFRDLGIFNYVKFIAGIALVSYARNELASAFLASDAQKLLMIDSDIGWMVETVLRLLERGKKSPFVAAAPPHRRVNRDLIAQAAVQGKRDPGRFGLDYAVRLTDAERQRGRARTDDGFIKVAAVGTAFQLLDRSVFERIRVATPELAYTSPEGTAAHAYFDPFVRDGQSLGEDGAFCQRWADVGGEIELLLEAEMTHEGPVAITGSLHQVMYDVDGAAVREKA